jgi:hypothetical protein
MLPYPMARIKQNAGKLKIHPEHDPYQDASNANF